MESASIKAYRAATAPRFSPAASRKALSSTSLQATSPEISAMIISGLAHVGFNTAGFSGISARKGGLSSESPLRSKRASRKPSSGCRAGTRRTCASYVSLNSPTFLYRTYEAFDL